MAGKPLLSIICRCVAVSAICLSLLAVGTASVGKELRNVTLQLRWFHQFQFAGYYAAIEKGFYRDEGLSVELKEGGYSVDTVDEVTQGRADFGVTDSEIVLARLRDKKKVTVLAAVFQHSPLVLVARKSTGIRTAQDLAGKTVKMTRKPRDTELHTMFHNEGIPFDRMTIMEGENRYSHYFDDRIDALSAYITKEPFYYLEKNVPYTVIQPLTYGVDFYGDCLFAGEDMVNRSPRLVQRFISASLKGWEYAMSHRRQMIDLIEEKYNTGKSRAHLEYEAESMERLIMPSLIEIGHMNPGRWRYIADTFAQQGIIDKDYSLEGFLYNPGAPADYTWFWWSIGIISLVTIPVILVAVILFRFNKRLNREVFERKQAEERLREREARLKVLFEDAPDALMVSNEKDEILDVNAEAERMLGYSAEELLHMRIPDLQAPEFRGEYGTVIRKELERQFPFEGVDLCKDGTRIPVEIHVRAIHLAGERLALSIVRDISDRKKAEEEKILARKQAAEQEKNALVGQVAGKMAHDFNNVLGAVMGNAELSLYTCSDEKLRERLNLIVEQTERGRALTRNLVAFAKDQEPKQEFFSVNEKIDLVLNLLKRDLEGISFVREFSDGLPDILADPGMIEHAMVNMIQNSIHALSKTDDPEIRLRTYGNDTMIHIEIGDNGCGIPEKHFKNIYTPSFTLKGSRDTQGVYDPDIKGTGYGMANVKKYVEKHRGTIEFSSSPATGTTFTISLPVMKKKLSSAEIDRIKTVTVETGKRILLVEDEPAIYEVQTSILAKDPFFHKVDIAVDADTARSYFTRNSYDMVSLDYLLSGDETGIDIYHFIREQDMDIPILFISGNIEFIESIKNLKQEDKLVDHISKPCQNSEYVNLVNRLLKKRERERGSRAQAG